jgi:predicted lipoprotein with Yx(FWY)xxD motif
MEESSEKKSAYGKRPLWQWFAMYAVVAIVIYGIIYFVFLHKQNSYSYQQPQSSTINTKTQTQNTVYKMMPKEKLGTVMTDTKGMTLYTYAKDTTGMSNCTGKCLANWPAYIAPANVSNLPANISVVKRDDGTMQYAYKGMPVYYYTKDGDSGDAYGNGVGGVWSVIK